ncbi:unnamed protein product [Trichogramma brassicae]|uniref:Uncharacterized protein n=1 Tax=Trichogramma brassicae TaxID=86971 RepID=A0A6H5I675_9HYME|nr:unnamed protein product [Trichogramma brassicae]
MQADDNTEESSRCQENFYAGEHGRQSGGVVQHQPTDAQVESRRSASLRRRGRCARRRGTISPAEEPVTRQIRHGVTGQPLGARFLQARDESTAPEALVEQQQVPVAQHVEAAAQSKAQTQTESEGAEPHGTVAGQAEDVPDWRADAAVNQRKRQVTGSDHLSGKRDRPRSLDHVDHHAEACKSNLRGSSYHKYDEQTIDNSSRDIRSIVAVRETLNSCPSVKVKIVNFACTGEPTRIHVARTTLCEWILQTIYQRRVSEPNVNCNYCDGRGRP